MCLEKLKEQAAHGHAVGSGDMITEGSAATVRQSRAVLLDDLPASARFAVTPTSPTGSLVTAASGLKTSPVDGLRLISRRWQSSTSTAGGGQV